MEAHRPARAGDEAGGVGGAVERAGVDRGHRDVGEELPQRLGLHDPALGQRDRVGGAHVAAGVEGLGLGVAQQVEAALDRRRQRRRALSHGS